MSPMLRWGISADLRAGPFTVDEICCKNRRFAELKGFWMQNEAFVKTSKKVSKKAPLRFFDSVCGAEVFRAPVNRSLDSWLEESEEHGWPSFRTQEAVMENLVMMPGGEVQSVCGTHLGHNIPDAQGDRYCIDLVCIAGEENQVQTSLQVYFGCGRCFQEHLKRF